jgi:hypothetical protein
MDISKELKQINDGSKSVDDIYTDIEAQKKELDIKSHIFWAINIKNKIQELLENNLFSRYDAKELKIINATNIYNQGNNLRIDLYNFDKEDLDIDEILTDDNFLSLKKLMRKLQLQDNNVNPQLNNIDGTFLKIDENLHGNIFELLLSKELKSFLEYSELEASMHSQNSHVKKSKL